MTTTIKPHFTRDPEILWEKVMCPVCGNPTGPESDCYNNKESRTIQHPSMGLLPIFSVSCTFRQDNIWRASLNYDVSQPLVDRLTVLPGVKKLFPIDKYTFQLVVGRLFDENKVKAEINHTFRAFIKEIQAKELNYIQPLDEKSVQVLFPNGNKIILPEGTVAIGEIVDSIEGVKVISEKVSEAPEKDRD